MCYKKSLVFCKTNVFRKTFFYLEILQHLLVSLHIVYLNMIMPYVVVIFHFFEQHSLSSMLDGLLL